MKDEDKVDLIKRGILRSTVAIGTVAGLTALKPELFLVSSIVGYGSVMGSLKLTKNKMQERAQNALSQEKDNSRPWLQPRIEPAENLVERIEKKILHPVDTIIESADVIKKKVENYQENKRSRLILKSEKKLLKLKEKIREAEFELNYLKNQ